VPAVTYARLRVVLRYTGAGGTRHIVKTGDRAGPTLFFARRMWVNLVSALLIIVQVVLLPAARALSSDTACIGCDYAAPAGDA